ncbi:MAG: dehydrogenase [Burkholderiaceae bacterium]|jgi:D-glycero-alpha-D-manno-heptose-7-phosphate kinase|nr:dehydrogenase [Burkholderiaceae bacterium]
MIVRSRAPLRLGLAGGGTDVSPYSDRYGGLVLNVTIDKYAYATIAARDDGDIRLVAADNCVEWQGGATARLAPVPGLCLHVGVYNRIMRDYHDGQPLAVTITTHADAPPGSGLGSSSTIVVALIHAFCEYLQIPLGEYDIAYLAYQIERGDLGLAGGKQDQYAAVFGGLNFMEFYGDDRVIVNPLRIKHAVKAEFESSLVLFYTGVSRESAKIIKQQTASVTDSSNTTPLEALHQLRQGAVKMKEAILKGDLERFARSMRLSWESKKKIAQSISNSAIDKVYDAAIEAGALAGKVSGAGGGGFMMFIVEPTSRPAVMRRLSEFPGQTFTCCFTEEGAYSWRVNA